MSAIREVRGSECGCIPISAPGRGRRARSCDAGEHLKGKKERRASAFTPALSSHAPPRPTRAFRNAGEPSRAQPPRPTRAFRNAGEPARAAPPPTRAFAMPGKQRARSLAPCGKKRQRIPFRRSKLLVVMVGKVWYDNSVICHRSAGRKTTMNAAVAPRF